MECILVINYLIAIKSANTIINNNIVFCCLSKFNFKK